MTKVMMVIMMLISFFSLKRFSNISLKNGSIF